MAEDVIMPRLSDTMLEGTISQWLKKQGDDVKRGDAVLEVETDKSTMTVDAYTDGVLRLITVPAGSTVPIGTVLGRIAAAADVIDVPVPARAPTVADVVAPVPTPTPSLATDASTSNGNVRAGRVFASPLARNIAREHQIDLSVLAGTGSGPRGRIVKIDIERYMATAQQVVVTAVPAAPVAPAVAAWTIPDDADVRPANRIQQVIARRLSESKATIPHFYVTNEVDMGAAGELRRQLVAALGDQGKVSFNDLIIRACAVALRQIPEVNASWRDGQFVVYQHVNVGVAVNVPNGLVVPVVRDADTKTVRQISAEVRALAEKGRAGKLTPREMEGGTFSISNLGMFDVEEFQAIINPPESAILAIGSITDKAVVRDGQIVIRPTMRLTLSVDHRVIPGVPAAQFLQVVKKLLQEPLSLGF